MSTGLGYPPGIFAHEDELTAFAGWAADAGKLFTSHLKAYSWLSGALHLANAVLLVVLAAHLAGALGVRPLVGRLLLGVAAAAGFAAPWITDWPTPVPRFTAVDSPPFRK